MPLLLLPLLALPGLQDREVATHDPRLDPTLARHALFRIADATGRVAAVGDVDGDGLPDLLTGRGAQLTLRSGADGASLGDLGVGEDWAVGPDLDGDGLSDLAAGRPSERLVVLRSIREGNVLASFEAPRLAGFGAAIVWIDDLDDDGVRDLVVGAPGARLVQARSSRTGERLWESALGERKGWGRRLRVVGDVDRDDWTDLTVGSGPFDREVNELVSGRNGELAVEGWRARGPARGVGDLDGDGVPDLFVDELYPDSNMRAPEGRVVSVGRRRVVARQAYPDMMSEYGTTTALGDLDGDGVVDLGLGEPNFHVKGPGDPGFEGPAVDLEGLTLPEAVALPSRPWCAFTWESGCAWVLSGRSREVIMAVYGEPGSRDGMGLAMSPLPDLSGDGHPDLAVTAADGVHVFAGPGRP